MTCRGVVSPCCGDVSIGACSQKCAFCLAPFEGNEKGPVVTLNKSTRTATCPVCRSRGNRDQRAGVNIETVTWSMVVTGERTSAMDARWRHRYTLRPHRRRMFATW